MTSDWTGWVDIDKSADYDKFAVYKIRLVDSSGSRFQLERLLKLDKEGIMCIGHTSNMERRRNEALSGMQKCRGHSAMNLVFYLNKYTEFPRKFRDAEFQYSFLRCSSKNESKNCESALIKEYFKKFGEAPPLNGSIPDRDNGW